MPIAICRHLLAIVFAFISVPYVLAEVHPGLKNAIDKGDYKTAQNLKQKMNVRGVYLPASLSIKDAEFIYGGPLTGYKWILGLDKYNNCSKDESSECSPEFVDKYIAQICSGKSEFDVSACIDWMKSTSMEDIDHYKGNFCNSKENISVCSLYVSKLDMESQLNYLKELDQKGLVEFPITAEIDTVVKEKLPKKECLEKWEGIYSVIKASIENDAQYHHSKGYFRESIICSFDGSAKKKKKCLSYLDEFSKNMKKECISGKIEVDVTKKMKVKRTQKPFENIIRKFSLELEKTPWFEMDDVWIEKVKFVQKYEKIEEKELAKKITDYYASYGDIPLSNVKGACILFPAIDKYVEENFGVNIFSCSQILNDYPHYLDLTCTTGDSAQIKELPTGLKYSETATTPFLCNAQTGKYRRLDQFELASHKSCENPKFSWVKKINSDLFICDKHRGKLINPEPALLDSIGQDLCNDAESNWMISYFNGTDSTTLVCERKKKLLRKPYLVEKEVGICTKENELTEYALTVCFDEEWQNTTEVNTKNLQFAPGKIIAGEIIPHYTYFKDFRDDHVYRSVQIGDQVWMAENLNYYGSEPALKNSKCTDNNENVCNLFGRLYNGFAALNISEADFQNQNRKQQELFLKHPLRGICPEGWHLPTESEWNKLISVAGGRQWNAGGNHAGRSLSSKLLWRDGGGNDKFGFSVYPFGNRFWTSTIDEYNQFVYIMINRTLYISKERLYNLPDIFLNIRCIKD